MNCDSILVSELEPFLFGSLEDVMIFGEGRAKILLKICTNNVGIWEIENPRIRPIYPPICPTNECMLSALKYE